MRKMKRVINDSGNIQEGYEWILTNVSESSIKRDGTACFYNNGIWFKRYDAKKFTIDYKTGKKNIWNRTPPDGFEPCQEECDPVTGHWPGWVPVVDTDYYILEAISRCADFHNNEFKEGSTYECCGPKINSNKEKLKEHWMFKHGHEVVSDFPLNIKDFKKYLEQLNHEGVVFQHRESGLRCKLRKKDFGLKW